MSDPAAETGTESGTGGAAGANPQAATEPVPLLIGARGGEGGGVLTDWIVAAAMAAGYPVQSTSIPGVAQRTGATTYYIEVYPEPADTLNGRTPVMSLYPAPGRVDLAVMSELVEAGRAMENGMVTPERTVLIASTHRVYAIAEKTAMGDGRYDPEPILHAARELARRPLLFDMSQAAQESGSVINAVLLGAIAGSGVLPFEREQFEQAIRDKGVAVEPNLRGFQAGYERAAASGEGTVTTAAPAAKVSRADRAPERLRQRIEAELPEPVREVALEGVARLVDYQDVRYAEQYLERLAEVRQADERHGGSGSGFALTREVARHLALWMSYEDAIRVAALKTRPGRIAGVRADLGAAPGEPVRITEFLDPGIEEICAILPRFVGGPIMRFAERHPWLERYRRPMEVRTDTVLGFLTLWGMARLRRFRRWSYRYGDEHALIGQWLAAVLAAAEADYGLALETAALARLIKGYGDTYRRGRGNFLAIYEGLLTPAMNGGGAWPSAERVRQAKDAALAGPEGDELAETLGQVPAGR
ncbi:MAG: indolepyruvate oxidoreductase subunit beta family protein [SAR324 cluster bacterium]|nr:indolepyruvate oxidoreductase subunit beta family protein [SAR324 cluster bacterium]